MNSVIFGRKTFSFSEGTTVLTRTCVTEKALSGENEDAFTHRLLKKFQDKQGTIEVVFKNGRPDYAIITFD